MKASVCERKKKKKKKKRNLCECVDTYVRKYTWPKLRGVAMCVRACEKKKMRNLILKPFHGFPSKISRYTVYSPLRIGYDNTYASLEDRSI